MKIGDFFFKVRGYTPIPFLLTAIIFAQPVKDLVIFGSILVVFGELMRIWGVSYAGGATRTRNVGAPDLVSNGPFAFIRNPLYIGNIFIYMGAIILSGALLPHLLYLVIIFFSIQYTFIVLFEEKELHNLFGEKYEKYLESVPRFYPRLSPYPGRTKIKGDITRAIKSEKTTFLAIFLFLIIFSIRWSYMI